MKSERKFGLDLIRAIAICSIMLVHFISFSGGVGRDLRSISWVCYAFIRYFSAIGVPLFLLLTGFLQTGRNADKKHYSSIIPVLVSYFVISIINVLTESIAFNKDFSLYKFVVSLFDFEYGYAWYVEMYLGLFLIIPFLNILYRNIDKLQKLLLIGTLSFITFIPSALQYFRIADTTLELVPDFFMNLYPLSLYFIGAYIGEYKPTPKKLICFCVLGLTLIFEVALCYFGSSTEYAWWLFNNNASLPHIICAVSLFLALWNVGEIRFIKTPVTWVSKASFEMYLISYITDLLCYSFLTISLWKILIVDFLFAFVLAIIIRALTFPIVKLLKDSVIKKRISS